MPPAADAAGGTLFIAYPSGRKVWYNNYRQNLTAILKVLCRFYGIRKSMETEGKHRVRDRFLAAVPRAACGPPQNYGRGKRPGTAVGIGVPVSRWGNAFPEELEKARKQAEERERQTWEKGAPLSGDAAGHFLL